MNAAERVAELQALASGTRWFGRNLVWPDEATSTNDLCHADGREGFAALAERQTAGRGTHGRRWEAPAGLGVLLSAMVPAEPHADDAFLSALAALGVAEALTEVAGLSARLKWPNDVLVADRKICGAMVERRRRAVLGVGLNVLQAAADFPPDPRWPPTSVRLQGGCVDRVALAAAVLRSWDRWWGAAPEALHAAWATRAWPPLGTPVSVTLSDGSSVAGELLALRLDRGAALRTSAGVEDLPAARIAAIVPDE